MKLAEALQERADLNRTIQQLKERLDNNVLVQEGEQPAEQPERLKQELDAAIQRLEYLMARINHTPDLCGGKEPDRADCTQGCAVLKAARL